MYKERKPTFRNALIKHDKVVNSRFKNTTEILYQCNTQHAQKAKTG